MTLIYNETEYIDLECISEHPDEPIILRGRVIEVNTKLSFDEITFECTSCMNETKVIQSYLNKQEIKPEICTQCGNREFVGKNDSYTMYHHEILLEFGHTQQVKIFTATFTPQCEDDYGEFIHKGTLIEAYGQLHIHYPTKTLYLELENLMKIDSLIEEKEVIERNNPKYKQWRKTVLSRDSKCIVCGSDENLNVHHLFSYKEYPELRINEGNGVTLCDRCHTNFHKQYGKTGGTPVDLINFVISPCNPHKSKEEKLNLVTDIIKEVYDRWGSAPRISVYGIIKDRLGVDDDKIDELINILKIKGIIFEPKPDYYKVI